MPFQLTEFLAYLRSHATKDVEFRNLYVDDLSFVNLQFRSIRDIHYKTWIYKNSVISTGIE